MKKGILPIFFLFVSATVFGQVGANYITAFYPLDGNAVDSSGNGLDGQLFGPVATADRFGNPSGAPLFDGNNDYVELNNNNPVITTDSFTIAFWIKLNGQGGGQQSQNLVFSQRSNTTASYNTVAQIFMNNGSDTFTYALRSDANVFGDRIKLPASMFQYGQWYHVACTYTSNDVAAVYINGDLMYSLPFTQYGMFTGGVDFVSIGRHRYFDTNYGFLNGAVDDLRIYSTALNEQQIDSIYHGLSTGINEPTEDEAIHLYPNITTVNAVITVQVPPSLQRGNSMTIQVYNTKGQLVESDNIQESHQISFPVRGLYLVELIDDKIGFVWQGKVVVQ